MDLIPKTHIYEARKEFIKYLKCILPPPLMTLDKSKIERDENGLVTVSKIILPFSDRGTIKLENKYIKGWLLMDEFMAWLEIFNTYNIDKVEIEEFDFSYINGIRVDLKTKLHADTYSLEVKFKYKE